MPEWIKTSLKAIKNVSHINLGRAFDSRDPTLEVNLLAYGFGVVMAAVWLSVALHKATGLDGNWVAAMGVFLTAVTGGLFKKGADANRDGEDKGARAPDKDGEP